MQYKALAIPAFFLVLGLAAGAPVVALAQGSSEREQAEQMAREAMEQLMRALELMIESIPQYEMPEINEDGDIIIRRKRRPRREAPDEPEIDETTT
jgi:hypothetical protein